MAGLLLCRSPPVREIFHRTGALHLALQSEGVRASWAFAFVGTCFESRPFNNNLAKKGYAFSHIGMILLSYFLQQTQQKVLLYRAELPEHLTVDVRALTGCLGK